MCRIMKIVKLIWFRNAIDKWWSSCCGVLPPADDAPQTNEPLLMLFNAACRQRHTTQHLL